MKKLNVLTITKVTIGFSALLFSASVAAQQKTADYWKCYNRVGGTWGAFGIIPSACDVDPFLDPKFVSSQIPQIVFDITKTTDVERRRYMQELHPVIREIARNYLIRRNPKASGEEKAAWEHAVYAIAHQESYWSHYRTTSDRRIKMTRGDYGHGHGLMQIDDRWHFTAVSDGLGANVFDNLLYALDEFYEHWQTAPSARCVKNPDFKAIARSAYSAYNGGARRICRWTDPKDKWAKNDAGYLEKWNGAKWTNYVVDKNREPAFDVGCFVEGAQNCPPPGQPADRWEVNTLYRIKENSFCRYAQGELACVGTFADVSCLNAVYGPAASGPKEASAFYEATRPVTRVLDRHELCGPNVTGLLPVGQMVRVLKNINLRKTPAGEFLVTISQGEVMQVLDFEVREKEKLGRYYRVRHRSFDGYIYAGDASDHRDWAEATQIRDTRRLIGMANDTLTVKNAYGINLRNEIGGSVLVNIPPEKAVQVFGVVVRGDGNSVYYEVEYAGRRGFIYGGQVKPELTLPSWAVLTPGVVK